MNCEQAINNPTAFGQQENAESRESTSNGISRRALWST